MILTKCRYRVTVLVCLVKVAAVRNLEFYFKFLYILLTQTVSSPQHVCKENSLLGREDHFVESRLGLDHRNNVAGLMFKLLTKENFAIRNADQIQIALQLSTEHCVFVDLK